MLLLAGCLGGGPETETAVGELAGDDSMCEIGDYFYMDDLGAWVMVDGMEGRYATICVIDAVTVGTQTYTGSEIGPNLNGINAIMATSSCQNLSMMRCEQTRREHIE